jgi:hypothetical protein
VTAERYTVVFTGLLSAKRPGEYPCLNMSEDPGAVGAGSTPRRGRTPGERLRREVRFGDLPEGCRSLALDNYEELWGL